MLFDGLKYFIVSYEKELNTFFFFLSYELMLFAEKKAHPKENLWGASLCKTET